MIQAAGSGRFVRTARPLYGRLVRAVGGSHLERGACIRRASAARTRAGGRLGISRTTVVSAYRELESRGLLRGYVGRGTFVCAPPDPSGAPFAWRGKVAAAALRTTDSTMRDLVRHSSNGRLLSLAAGVPAIDCFPVAAFGKRSSEHQREGPPSGGTGPPKGSRSCARRSPSASVCRRTACSCLRARSRGWTWWRAASSIPATRSSSTAGLSRRDPVVPRRRRQARRLGRHRRRHRRARGSAGPLSSEAALHEPDVPESDRRHDADPRAARAAEARGTLPRADGRGRDLPRALFRRPASTVLARARVRRRRHPPQQVLEGARAGPPAWVVSAARIDRRSAGDGQAALDPHTQNLVQFALARLIRDGGFDATCRRCGPSTHGAAR